MKSHWRDKYLKLKWNYTLKILHKMAKYKFKNDVFLQNTIN